MTLLIGAVGLLLGGCASAQTSEPGSAAEPAVIGEGANGPSIGAGAESVDDGCTAANPCTITVRWWGGDARQALQLEAIRIFEEQNPNIRINAEPVALDSYFDTLTVEAAANNEPDVFTLGGAWPLTLGRDGVTQPINDLVDTSHLSTGAVAEATENGQIFAVPTGGNATALVANPRIFEQAGVSLPDDDNWTWEQFVEIANQISANTPEGTFGVEMRPEAILGSYAAQRDGIGLYAPDGQINVSENTLADYFQMILDLQDGGGMPPAEEMTQLAEVGPEETLLGRGLGAMLFAPSNQLPALANASGDNLVLLRIPGETQFESVGVALTPSQWWAIGSNTPYPHAAGRFIDFMINDPQSAMVQNDQTIMGIDRGNPLNPAQADAIAPLLDADQNRVIEYVARIAQHAGAAIPQPTGAEDQPNISISTQQSVASGQLTPQQAAASWLSRMQTELAAIQ